MQPEFFGQECLTEHGRLETTRADVGKIRAGCVRFVLRARVLDSWRVSNQSLRIQREHHARDRRCMAAQGGGSLSRHKHHLLALWATACAAQVLSALWKAAE